MTGVCMHAPRRYTTTVRAEIDVNMDPEGYCMAKGKFDVAHQPFADAVKRYEAEQLPAKRMQLEDAFKSNGDKPQWAVGDLLSGRGVKTAALQQWIATTDPEWRRLKAAEGEKETPPSVVPAPRALPCCPPA